MVSFARARTRSLLARLWPVTAQKIKDESAELDSSKNLIENQESQNKYFLEAIKNGGLWFS